MAAAALLTVEPALLLGAHDANYRGGALVQLTLPSDTLLFRPLFVGHGLRARLHVHLDRRHALNRPLVCPRHVAVLHSARARCAAATTSSSVNTDAAANQEREEAGGERRQTLMEKNMGPSSASHSGSTAVTLFMYSLCVYTSSW